MNMKMKMKMSLYCQCVYMRMRDFCQSSQSREGGDVNYLACILSLSGSTAGWNWVDKKLPQ